MKIAVMTMVYQEYEMLARWVRHYSDLVGEDNLYIISHGNDPEHRRIAPKAHFIGIPREHLGDTFDKVRQPALADLQQFLNAFYPVVMKTDVDEFIFVDPNIHDSLASCFEAHPANAWYALGFEIYQAENDDNLTPEMLISEHRSTCVCSSFMSKAIAARSGYKLRYHGVGAHKRGVVPDGLCLPKGLYLAHAKFANLSEVAKTDIQRELVGDPRHKNGWGNATRVTKRTLRKVFKMDRVDADQELSRFYAEMSGDFGFHRKARPATAVVPVSMGEVRYDLPQRFKGCF